MEGGEVPGQPQAPGLEARGCREALPAGRRTQLRPKVAEAGDQQQRELGHQQNQLQREVQELLPAGEKLAMMILK